MRRWILIAVALLALTGAGGAAYLVLSDEDPPRKRGSAKVEFDPTEKPAPKPKRRVQIAWPTFGYDIQRTKVSPWNHRPPFGRTLWRIDGLDTFEFPPSAGYGNVYIAQQKGLFFALDGKTGKPVFKRKNYRRCAASSPTIANGTIYQSYMHPVGDLSNPCPQGAADPKGFVVAIDARTGREKWRYRGMPFESSPLLRNGILYVGSWDGQVHAIRASNGRRVWTHQTGAKVNTSAAYSDGRIFVGNQSSTLYALSARTGRRLWSASDATEFFYATPAVAYGRVFIGSSDGTMYSYGAKTGRLLWAKPLGTYIYASAAIAEKKVFTGTYDGKFYALDAATGDVRWQREMASAVHSAPVIMDGLVYTATCATCGSAASRFVKMGRDGTTAFRIRDGRKVWTNNSGKYASPIIADQDRVYLTGRSFLYALEPRKAERKQVEKKKQARKPKRRR